jgi:hypothetical protein
MPHLFGLDYRDRGQLKRIKKDWDDIPKGLERDINDFHSLDAMSVALEKFGLGERDIKFEEALAGDVIGFDRDLDKLDGGKKPSGHSVIFLSFLTRDQKEISKYIPGKVVGFKYFSSQSSQPAGLSERWAYFKGEMCPFVEGKKKPAKPTSGYCADAISTGANRAKFPKLKGEQTPDCCVIREGRNGPRVGRILSPRYWTFAAKQAEVRQQEKMVRAHVEEYMETRARNGEVLKLLAAATIAMQKRKPQLINNYIKQVQTKFGEDLRNIAQKKDEVPSIATRTIRGIYRITPRSVINEANEQVTTRGKNDLETRVKTRAAERMRLLAESGGTANSKYEEEGSD